jgi:hypothetical protein
LLHCEGHRRQNRHGQYREEFQSGRQYRPANTLVSPLA